jgi:hypothetical protein
MKEIESYGPDPLLVGFWTFLCSPPALIWGYGLLHHPTRDGLTGFIISLGFAVLPLLFALRFRVTFTPTEFVYRRWAPTVRVPYSEISAIEVTNVTPITKAAVGAFVVTKRGSRYPFWPKLFPRAAVDRFFDLSP